MGVLDLDIKDVYAYRPSTRKELMDIIHRLCKGATGTVDLNMIDVSGIMDMSYLFYGVDYGNINISNWDVSKVGNISLMFYKSQFNGDIPGWDLPNAKGVELMYTPWNP